MLDEHLTNMPWTDFGIDLIIGSIADREATQQEQFFLPIYIHDYFQETFIDGKPIVKEENLMLDFIKERSDYKESILAPKNIFILLLVLEIIFLILFLGFKKMKGLGIKIYDRIWYLTLAIGSLILLFMWFGTDHLATNNNWNLVWMNPLYLLLLFPKKWISTSRKKQVAVFLFILNLITLFGLVDYFQDLHFICYYIAGIMAIKLFRFYRSADVPSYDLEEA